MPAFRSLVSVLVRFVGRSFSTNSRPALRAAACGGRPRAGSDPTVTGAPASPSTPGGTNLGRRRRKILPVSHRRRTGRRLIALPPGFLADLLGAIPASLTLILEPVLGSPTTPRAPHPPKRRPDLVQHGPPTSLPAPTLIFIQHKHKERKRWTKPARPPPWPGHPGRHLHLDSLGRRRTGLGPS
jgi:hypothetical protein